MAEPLEKPSTRRRALYALFVGALLLLAFQLLLPAVALKAINHQLAPASLKLSASVRVSLPNQLTLSNVHIQSISQENAVSAERISVTLRASALLNRNPQRLAKISLQGLRGSWNLRSTPPDTNLAAPAKLPIPKHVPDAIEINIQDLSLTLPPTPGAPVRRVLIKDLSLDASTTREGTFHIGNLKVGDSDLLNEVIGETTFFDKQLSIKELKLSAANFIERLQIDFGTVSDQPSINFLLLRGNGYISAKASISSSQDGPSLSLRTDAENVTLPLDPFAAITPNTLPQLEIHETHTAFEGRLNHPSSWRAKASFSGALIDANDSNKKSVLVTEMSLSESALNLEKLSVADASLQLNATASAFIRSNAQSFSESLSSMASQCSIKYASATTTSPLREIAKHFGNPLPEWLPSTQIAANLTQPKDNALTLTADFEFSTAAESPPLHPAKASLLWIAPSLNEISTGTLEIETEAFQTMFCNVPFSFPRSSLRVISHHPDRQLTLRLHLLKGSIPILTQQGTDAPWKLDFQNIPVSEILPHLPRENPCTLSAEGTLARTENSHQNLSALVRITDPTNAAHLEANIRRTKGTPAKLNATLVQPTSRVAVAEITLPLDSSTSETTITSTGNLANANTFRNILSLINLSTTPASRIAWSATATLSHQHPLPIGRISGEASGISFGKIGPIDLKSTVQSNGSSIETQTTTLTLGETTATGSLQWSSILAIKDLRILQRHRPVLNGELSIHHPVTKSAVPNPDTPLFASLEADQLDLATLLGESSPLSGKIRGSLTLNGTLDQPVVRGRLTSSNILLPDGLAPLNPVTLDIQAHPTPGTISLSAKLTSALNAPVEMAYKGSIHSLLGTSSPSSNTEPDTFSLNLKGGSLHPLNKLHDIFKSVTGSVDVALSAKRSAGHWEWSGKSSVKAPKILFESPRAPGLTDLTLTAVVHDSNKTSVDLLTSSGGGTIRIRGDIRAPLSPNPDLDLSIQTRNVLAYRNESLLLRADSDLSFKGPWKEASISGEAAPVQSKYLHDIEILPINLTKTGETRDRLKGLSPGFSFTQAPYSDWKFNIHFKSRPRDPMLVRGNRWQGEADVDMIWGGTGLRPWFEGYYHSKNLVAFLPSVRLAVTDGYLWYKRDTPFQGTLDVNALTTARAYRIAAYISGPLSQPDLLLTSKPALDQTDILSLLTTGVLPSDTNDGPQVIAARATEAIAEDISRSLLGVDRRMIEGIGRVDVEFSRVNPRTGQQETRVTRRLSEDWSVSGDIGTNGDFTGRLKFLHRFK
jgi:hypothetical protein